MESEHVLEVTVRRHVIDSERPFATVLRGIFDGISQPDIEKLFGQLAASTSYEDFSSLVRKAQAGSQIAQGQIGKHHFRPNAFLLGSRGDACELITRTRLIGAS